MKEITVKLTIGDDGRVMLNGLNALGKPTEIVIDSTAASLSKADGDTLDVITASMPGFDEHYGELIHYNDYVKSWFALWNPEQIRRMTPQEELNAASGEPNRSEEAMDR